MRFRKKDELVILLKKDKVLKKALNKNHWIVTTNLVIRTIVLRRTSS